MRVPETHASGPAHRRQLAKAVNQISGRDPAIDAYIVEDADMSNSWVNRDATRKVRYWKDAMGVVHITGHVKSGSIGTNEIFTLSVGFRPDYVDATGPRLQFAVPSNSLFGQVNIVYTGVVEASVGDNTWVALDGITFKAAD